MLALFLSSSLDAQEGYELGIHLGVAHYYGDLNPEFAISDPGLNFGFRARRNFNERVCVTLGLDYGKLSGSDENAVNAFEQSRNLDFRSNVYDISATMEFNFFPYIHGSADEHFTPYLFGGFSLFRYNPKTDLNGDTYELIEFQTEGSDYYGTSLGFVFGMGVKWDINRDFSFNVSLNGRRAFTDYIDDVSQNYVNITGDAIGEALANRSPDIDFGRPGTQRGDSKGHDSFFFLNVGFMRYFGQLKCPPISRNISL